MAQEPRRTLFQANNISSNKEEVLTSSRGTQPLLAGSTLFLTSLVLISLDSDHTTYGTLSAPPDDKSCCLRVDNERFSSECLFQLVYRRDGQARTSLEDEISKNQKASAKSKGPTISRTNTSRTMKVESSDDVLDSMFNWDSSEASDVDKEMTDFKKAYKDFGEPLRFGHYVNLLHVVSNKVVTKTSVTAGAELQCLEVALTKGISTDSYFQVMSQYKSRSVGELVYSGDTIHLKCCGGAGDFYLRSSNKLKIEDDAEYGFLDASEKIKLLGSTKNGSRRGSMPHVKISDEFRNWSLLREVNASNNPSAWMFNIYSQFDSILPSYLTAVSPFRLRHPETDCYLSHTIVTQKANASLRLKGDHDNVKTIWMFERYDTSTCWRGGVLHWGEPLRLLHVPTNLYLDVCRERTTNFSGSKSQIMHEAMLSEVGCPIILEASRSEIGPIKQADCILYLKINFKVPGQQEKTLYLYNTLQVDKRKEASVSKLHSPYMKKSKHNNFDGSIITFCTYKEPQNAFSIESVDAASLSSSLSVFSNVKTVHQLFKKTATYVREKKKVRGKLPEDIELPPKCLQKAKDLLIESTLATHDIGSGESKDEARKMLSTNPVGYLLDGHPAQETQDDMQTSHMIDIAMQIVCLPQLIGITLDKINTPKYHQVKHLVHLAYAFILNCLDNPKIKDYICAGFVCTYNDIGENKLYNDHDDLLEKLAKTDTEQWIADLKDVSSKKVGTSWINMMISHLGYELGVGEVLSQLFLDNHNLLHKGVTAKSIEIFIALIKSVGPQSRFLNFLKVLARCSQIDGSKNGITQNQELLMNTVFKNEAHGDVVMETALNLDAEKLRRSTNTPRRTYIKLAEKLFPSKVWDNVDVPKEVMGASLVEGEFHDILVSWAASTFWFPGMGAEYSLFHSAKFLGIENETDLSVSVVTHPAHAVRSKGSNNSDHPYNVEKPFGFEMSKTNYYSTVSKAVVKNLTQLVNDDARRNQGVYPNFEPKFLEVLEVSERRQLANKVMTLDNFVEVLEGFGVNEEVLPKTTFETFFRECCLEQEAPFPDIPPEGPALLILLNFIKVITQPINDLEWIRLEDLAWVLDMHFKSPISTWRKDFSFLHENPEDFNQRLDNFLCSRNKCDTIYHKVHCSDPACSGRVKGTGEPCQFYKHKETERWGSTRSLSNAKKTKEQLKHMKRLANFYNENLQLIAESCADRSNNCIRYFQIQYSFETVFTGITNECLPPEIRSSFTKLMISLYIDRYPHERVLTTFNNKYLEDEIDSILSSEGKVPLRAFESRRTEADQERIDDHIHSIQPSEEKAKVMEFFRKMSPDKFLLVRDYIANFLIMNRYISLGGKNKSFLALQSSVLDMVYELLDYGFYGSMQSLRKVLKPLLTLLDSRHQIDEDDSDDDLEGDEIEEDDEEMISSSRTSRTLRRTGNKSSSFGSMSFLDADDTDEAKSYSSSRRQYNFRTMSRGQQSGVSLKEVTNVASAAVNEAVSSNHEGDSIVTLDLNTTNTAVLPKYKLTNSNARIHTMRKQICKIVHLMCSRNSEIMMKRMLAAILENKKEINTLKRSMEAKRRNSVTHKSFLDNSNLEKFNAKYKKIYHGGDAEASSIKKMKSKFFKKGARISPSLGGPKMDSLPRDETFLDLAFNESKSHRDESDSDFMLSLFFSLTMIEEDQSNQIFLDLEEVMNSNNASNPSNSTDGLLLDLMMHEMPDLYEAALKLLTQRYFMKHSIYKSLRSAVVVGKEEAPTNEFLTRHLRQLRNDATSFELWKSNDQSYNSKAFSRSVQTLGAISRLTGIFGDGFSKKIDSGSNRGVSLLDGKKLELVREDVNVSDIDSNEDASPLINSLLFGIDSVTRNVSIYWQGVFSSCKFYVRTGIFSPTSISLPLLLGTFESGHNSIPSLGGMSIHNSLLTINNAVPVLLKILAIPFDELSVESATCPECEKEIPRTILALHMSNSDYNSTTFTCVCPNKAECRRSEPILLKKKQRELFALKRKCMSSLEHMALTTKDFREELTERLPEIEKFMNGGLGAENCFLAISSSPAYFKNELSETHIDNMIDVIVCCTGPAVNAPDGEPFKVIDSEPATAALRYLRLVAINDQRMRIAILRNLCEKTSIFTSGYLVSSASPFRKFYDVVSNLGTNKDLDLKVACEHVETLQVFTVTLNLLGELASSNETEIEGIIQSLLPLDKVVGILVRGMQIGFKVPFIHGVGIAISKCLICCWFSTSIGIPNLIKDYGQLLSWLINSITKQLKNFSRKAGKGQSAKDADDAESEEMLIGGTLASNPKELLHNHNRNTRSLAERTWIYAGVIPILCAFFDDDGPWDPREAPDALKDSNNNLAAVVMDFINLEKRNHDHTAELSKLAKLFGKIQVSDGGMQLGKRKRESLYKKATVPTTHLTTSDHSLPSTKLQSSLRQYVDYLDTRKSILYEVFRHDELVVAAKLIGNFFGAKNKLKLQSTGGWGERSDHSETDDDDLDKFEDEETSSGLDFEGISFGQIVQRMIRYTEGNLNLIIAGEEVSEQSMEMCKTNIILLQRCCELAASNFTNAEIHALSKTTWKGYGDTGNQKTDTESSEDDNNKGDDQTGAQNFSEENTTRLELIQETLGSMGALSLCTTIIGQVGNEDLVKESMVLGHWLVKHGKYENQTRFLSHITSSDSAYKFFKKIDSVFAQATETIAPGQQLQDNMAYNQLLVLVPFLKELMENHREELQICMGDQSSYYSANTKAPSFNILQRASSLILTITNDERAYTKKTRPELVILLTEILVFLIESTQGPCIENQNILVSCGVITGVKRILQYRLNVEMGTWEHMTGTEKKKTHGLPFATGHKAKSREEMVKDEGLSTLIITFKRLKEHAVKLCLSLLEGRNEDIYVHNKILQEMPSAILEQRLSQLFTRWSILVDSSLSAADEGDVAMNLPEAFREYINKQTWLDEGFEILALFKYLEKVSPGISRDKFVSSSTIPRIKIDSVFRNLVRAKVGQKKELDRLSLHVNELALFFKSTERKFKSHDDSMSFFDLPPNWESEKKKFDKFRFEKMLQKIVTRVLSKHDVGRSLEEAMYHKNSLKRARETFLTNFEQAKDFDFGTTINEIWSGHKAAMALSAISGDPIHTRVTKKDRSSTRDKAMKGALNAGGETTGASIRASQKISNKKENEKMKRNVQLGIVCEIFKRSLNVVRVSRDYFESISGSSKRITEVQNALAGISEIDKIIEKERPTDAILGKLLVKFKEVIPICRQLIRLMHPVIEHSRSFTYFSDRLKSIEVQNENQQVEKIFFKEPLVCEKWTKADKHRFEYNLKLVRGCADMKSFVAESKDIYHMLKHKEKLGSRKQILGLLDIGTLTTKQENIRRFQVRLVYMCSLILLLSIESKGDWTCCLPFDSSSSFYEDWPDGRGDVYTLENFYELNKQCGNATHPTYNVDDCTSAPHSDLLGDYKFKSPWHRVFLTFLLMLVCVFNILNAYIHYVQKHQVNVDKFKRQAAERKQQRGFGPCSEPGSAKNTDNDLTKKTATFFDVVSHFLFIPIAFIFIREIHHNEEQNADEEGWQDVIKSLSTLQVLVLIIFATYYLRRIVVFLGSRFTEEGDTTLKAYRKTFYSTQFIIPAFTAINAFLAIWQPAFIPLMGISVIESSDSLRIVFAAIYEPIQQLGMVSLLVIMVVFLFSSISFFYSRETYASTGVEGDYLWNSRSCNSLLNCFTTMATFGLIGWSDDFYGASFMGDYSAVVFANLLLFILVSVVVLNVITAILLDTFTKLRQERELHSYSIANNCVVCGMSSTSCDLFAAKMKNGKSFRHHITLDHSMHNYVLFIFHLMSKNADDYNGAESYVQRCLDGDNYNMWVPHMTSYDHQQAGLASVEIKTDGEENLALSTKGPGDELNSWVGGDKNRDTRGAGGGGKGLSVGGIKAHVDILSKPDAEKPMFMGSQELTELATSESPSKAASSKQAGVHTLMMAKNKFQRTTASSEL